MADSTRRSFPPAPTAARALLIQGHPRENSFNHALGAAWADGARSVGLDVDVVRAADLDFAPRLLEGTDQPLEPDLADLQDRIARAAHLTLAAPVWWGSTPALVKGLIDRTLQTGWAYGKDHRGNPIGGLTGRSGRLLFTMDAPKWWDRLLYGRSATRHVRDATFWFCGIKPARVSMFASIESTTAAQRDRMLKQAAEAGRADGEAVLRRLPAPALEQVAAR